MILPYIHLNKNERIYGVLGLDRLVEKEVKKTEEEKEREEFMNYTFQTRIPTQRSL